MIAFLRTEDEGNGSSLPGSKSVQRDDETIHERYLGEPLLEAAMVDMGVVMVWAGMGDIGNFVIRLHRYEGGGSPDEG